MKFMKFVLASLAVSCAFTATAFAAELSSDYNYTYSVEVTPATVNAGDTVEVAVYMSATDASGNPIDSISIPDDNDATLGVGLDFKDDVISIAVSRDTVATDTYLSNMFRKAKLDGTDNITMFYDGTYGVDIGEIAPDTALVRYTFTVLENAATATYDSSNPLVTLVAGTTETADALGNKVTTKKTMAACNTVNVVGTTPAGPSVSAGTVVDNVTEYTFKNSTAMAGQKVLVTTNATARTAIGENTRFYVSYKGEEPRTFGDDVWGKLAQGGGTISVDNIKFGIIVREDLNASDFTFEVK